MHAADRNTNCVQHNKTHVDKSARCRANSRPRTHTMTENGARVSEPRHVTETKDMSAGIQTPRSNMKQGTQTRERATRAHSKPRAHMKTRTWWEYQGLCHKTMNNTRPKWQNPDIMTKNSEDLKNRIVALHKDGVGYKKIAKTLKLCCSTVAKTVQRFNRTGFHSETGLATVDQRSWVHVLSIISRGCVWEIDVWVLPALLQRLKGWGGQPVSAQPIRRTLHEIGLHGCRPRRKPLLKMMHKKAHKHILKTSRLRDMYYWNMSCGLMRPR